MVSEPEQALLDVAPDAEPSQAALEVVDVRARETRVRGAEIREELAAPARLPEEAQGREERLPEGCPAQARPALDGVGDAGSRERRLERGAETLERRADEPDGLGRRPVTEQAQDLVRDELERRARAGALEEPDGSLERGRLRVGTVGEERPLQVGECRMGLRGRRRRQLLDPAVGESGEILGRPGKRRERGPSRLVRERHGHLRPAGQGLEQRPLRARQVLEAVGEHGAAVPGRQLALDALDGVPPLEVTIPEPQAVELVPVRGIERRDIAAHLGGVDEPRLQLGDGPEQRVAEPGEPRRRAEAVQARACDRPAESEGLLRLGRYLPRLPVAAGNPLEEVVERSDRAAEKRWPPDEQVALDAVDFRPVRDDEERLAVEILQVSLEEPRDLPRVRRANQQSERHRRQSSVRPGGHPSPRDGVRRPYALFGRRPRRATARPGIVPAQLSQRSAAFAPRLASVYVMRMPAPLPSATSAPQLSQTRIVFRATVFLLENGS